MTRKEMLNLPNSFYTVKTLTFEGTITIDLSHCAYGSFSFSFPWVLKEKKNQKSLRIRPWPPSVTKQLLLLNL